MDGQKIDRQPFVMVLGVWLSEDISDWSKNSSEICRKAYGRIGMLSKLNYVGFCTKDLLEINCFFLRSTAKYCSAVFASLLTVEQKRKFTNIERTCLKIIMKDMYVSYEAALEMCGLSSLSQRRSAHLLKFAQLSARHPVHGPRMFPENPNTHDILNIRPSEKYKFNFARGGGLFLQYHTHCTEAP